MAKKSASIEELDYEEALAELEAVISDLENGPVGLDKSVERFEKGKLLLEHCQKLLDSAELKVRQLENNGSTTIIED